MPSLLDSDLVVVTGKGGVGKSTVAAAVGIIAARRGMRVVVAEVGGRADTARLLAGQGVDHLSITPREAMDEYLRDQLPSPLAELLGRSGTFSAFVEATPGMHELLTVGKVWELTADPRRTPGEEPYDLVVLDAPASGHGLALLGAPRTFSESARIGPIHRQAGLIHESLSDAKRTAVVVVTLAEEMPVNETLELRDALRDRLGLGVSLVVVNGLAPDRFTDEEAAQLEALAGPADSPIGAALWAHRRGRAQAEQLGRLCAGLDSAPLELPLFFAASPEAGELADLVEPAL
ncbi:MAG: ArsA-related P-loop ATPase [Solirubrobacteraceae bacterium]